MPCDRINNSIESSENHFKWLKRTCLHTAYWEAVSGDIDLYNMLRNQWLDAFISDGFKLITSDDEVYEIRMGG